MGNAMRLSSCVARVYALAPIRRFAGLIAKGINAPSGRKDAGNKAMRAIASIKLPAILSREAGAVSVVSVLPFPF